MSEALHVVSLKWGTKYGPEYVNRLYHMLRRHLTHPFRFYCLTEQPAGLDADIHVLPLETSPQLSGWWYKLALFRQDFFGLEGNLLYLNLDLVIADNINFIAELPGEFLIIRNWSRNPMWNSSVMRFRIGKYAHVWDRFQEHAGEITSRYHGDQEWIFACVPEAGTWPQNKIVSYKKSFDAKAFRILEKLGLAKLGLSAPNWMDTPLPRGVSIVIFHGRPKPADVATRPYGLWKRASFVEKHWLNAQPIRGSAS